MKPSSRHGQWCNLMVEVFRHTSMVREDEPRLYQKAMELPEVEER